MTAFLCALRHILFCRDGEFDVVVAIGEFAVVRVEGFDGDAVNAFFHGLVNGEGSAVNPFVDVRRSDFRVLRVEREFVVGRVGVSVPFEFWRLGGYFGTRLGAPTLRSLLKRCVGSTLTVSSDFAAVIKPDLRKTSWPPVFQLVKLGICFQNTFDSGRRLARKFLPRQKRRTCAKVTNQKKLDKSSY